MGTRSLTVVQDDCGKEFVVMYRQYDGYPEGYGEELAEFLLNKKEVNGIPFGEDSSLIFNGASCLAASLFSFFKEETGGIYLEPAGTRNCGEEYLYMIKCNGAGKEPTVECWEAYEKTCIFTGSAFEMVVWIKGLDK